MTKANAGLRTRLKQLDWYQRQLKSARAELENRFRQMRLVEGRLQLEQTKRCYSTQIEWFGSMKAGSCDLVHPTSQEYG